jgi:sigma-E factor negative regulatory protein RseB
MRWLLMTASLVACLWPLAAPAAPESKAAAVAQARAWLARIHSAASSGNYSGTMVFSAGGTMSSSRVWHFSVGDQTYEQLEAQDGRQQRILRHNDTVHTLWPQTRVAVLEKREAMAAWSTTPQEIDPRALDQYELRREGDARIAGRSAVVFLLEPKDNLRYAQRFWADLDTGLLLRADVIGAVGAHAGVVPSSTGTQAGPLAANTAANTAANGAAPAMAGADPLRPVLESTAFSEIAIGVKPQPELITQAMLDERKKTPYRVMRPQQLRTSLEAEGWVLANPVPGFKHAGCVRRGMDTTGDGEPVLQAVFSDGLTHVSLFVETYRSQRHRSSDAQAQQAQQGANATLILRRGEFWVTAVGDVPPATLRLFVAALERKKP